MRNTIYRILYAIGLFCVTFLLLEVFASGTSTQTTKEMSEAVLPVVSMNAGSTAFNTLYGYTQEQDPGQLRTSLTPVSEERSIGVQISCYGQTITSLTMEVRSLTGTRLIEQETVDVEMGEDQLATAQLSFKNLIEPDTEYMLVLILSTEDVSDIRYYTRFIYSEDGETQETAVEAIQFAETFHEKTFDKTSEDYLLTYLEPSDDVSNSSLASVSIYNSADQVTWGDLNPAAITTPLYTVTDIEGDTIGIKGSFYVSAEAEEGETESTHLYRCEEYYELQKGQDRFYLMDYQRTMSQDFDPQHPDGTGGALNLGIASDDLQVVQTSQHSVIAFVHDGRLYEYASSEDLLVYIYGFDVAGDTGERETHAEHDIRILHVEEDGSADFLVYGYMNSGLHEGKMGISFYHYSGTYHTLEEKVFVPYTGSWERLNDKIEEISHYDVETGTLYLILEDALYEIDVNSCSLRMVENHLTERETVISANGVLVAYDETENNELTGRVILMNLNGLNRTVIEAPDGKRVIPLGFLGQDLVYGTASVADEAEDITGTELYPMDHIYIVDQELDVLEDYHQDGIYVTKCEIRDGQLMLTRVKKTESGDKTGLPYTEVESDTISSGTSESTSTLVQTSSSSRYGKTVQINMGVSDWSTCHYIRPQEILYEGSRELSPRTAAESSAGAGITEITDESGANEGTSDESEAAGSGTGKVLAEKTAQYYIYSCKGYLGTSFRISTAIEQADEETTGVVLDDSGQYVWKNTSNSRCEIDALTTMESAAALGDSRAACLKAMIQYAGESVTTEDVTSLLEQGSSVLDVLSRQLTDCEILDLTSCTMSEVLFYVEQGIPVYAALSDGRAVLIIGYGPENLELYDPAAGSVHLVTRSTAKEMFEETGNQFVSYLTTGG